VLCGNIAVTITGWRARMTTEKILTYTINDHTLEERAINIHGRMVITALFMIFVT